MFASTHCKTSEIMNANSLKECFYIDEHELNPVPNGIIRKIIALFLSSRYSMPVLMRLTQYYYLKSQKTPNYIKKKWYGLLSHISGRMNEVFNNFEHGVNPQIAAGVVFHHTCVCITSDTVIETGVHIYRNVTFGAKNGCSPYIKRNAKIASHSIIIGKVVIGEKAIVAPGAVVVKDVPSHKIAAGVPAAIIGDVTDVNYQF